MTVRKEYGLYLMGGPFHGTARTIMDVMPPPCYTDWDPRTGRVAMYRPVYDGLAIRRAGGAYRYAYGGLTDPSSGVEYMSREFTCTYCGRVYERRNGRFHFIPCSTCDALEHAGCRH